MNPKAALATPEAAQDLTARSHIRPGFLWITNILTEGPRPPQAPRRARPSRDHLHKKSARKRTFRSASTAAYPAKTVSSSTPVSGASSSRIAGRLSWLPEPASPPEGRSSRFTDRPS